MNIFSKLFKVISLVVLLSCGNAKADIRQIFYSTAGGQAPWKLENYANNGVAIWNTPSGCPFGSLGFPESFTLSDKNRFYATMIAVKTSNATMFIYYDEQPGSCLIASFGLM